jgi:phospholipid/cholesterol/gamma-HCH transport system permease protein
MPDEGVQPGLEPISPKTITKSWLNRLFTAAGHQALALVDYMGNVSLFFLDACRSLVHPPWFFREIIAQMFYLGVKTLPLTLVAAFSLGLVLAMQGVKVLTWFGAANYIATMVAFSVLREMGPMIAAIMLAARGGAGMGAELGSMRVTQQIDALTVSAINPMKYLVVTRIAACMLALPLLAVFANIFGILGGMVIGVYQVGLSANSYYYLTLKYLQVRDVLPGIGKCVIFGAIIGTVGCFHGYNTEHGTFGVGQSTKVAVVIAILLILISDVFLTKLTLLLWP